MVLPRLASDLAPLLEACCDGTLDAQEARWDSGACVTVVMASEGYPGSYARGRAIAGIEEAEALGDVLVFHAGTRFEDGALVTSGGRVLNVTARGADIESAIARAYEAAGKIRFDGAHYRSDIGRKAFKHLTS